MTKTLQNYNKNSMNNVKNNINYDKISISYNRNSINNIKNSMKF